MHYVGSVLDKPMQLRLPSELKAKIARIAEKNHLSEADVIRLCLAQIIPSIEQHGLTVFPADKPCASATAQKKKG
jgi:hypothetical protein